MSLVVTSNRDDDVVRRNEASIYSAWSYRNDLSSTYKIPPNSQVALQSCKVNLDGRITIGENNSWWYDWFGYDVDAIDNTDGTGTEVEEKINLTTSYPKLQDIDVARGSILELTTDELAERLKKYHREYHPLEMNQFDCDVKRNSGLDFLGFEFKYNQYTGNASTMPTSAEKFYNDEEAQRFSYNTGTGVFQRNAGTFVDPAVGILLGAPLSAVGGDCRVTISSANGSGLEWGFGLSRDCPNYFINEDEEYRPYYFDNFNDEDENEAMGLDNHLYFEDFGVHRNDLDELVLRHAVPTTDGSALVHKEVRYWLNVNGSLAGAGRYDMGTNALGYTAFQLSLNGEVIELYGINASGTDFITGFDATQPKRTYFRPCTQTNWCLHPVLFVGYDGITEQGQLTLASFSGVNITNYNSRLDSQFSKKGWFETASMLSNVDNFRPINRCRDLDLRTIFDPDETNAPYVYAQKELNASGVDYKYAMILKPNNTYHPTFGASTADLFGFPGRSLVMDGTGTFPAITFGSDVAPDLNCMKSIFVRLNGFGQQVINARTGNKSTILSHLPTADSSSSQGSSQRIFYEPSNLLWLDLNNPYEMVVSEFSIDFVYSNEQYAKILQGQSIVCLYFRVKDEK